MNRSECNGRPYGLRSKLNEVGWKARPLCAGVSVSDTMRALRHNVDARAKHILRHAPCGLSPRTPFQSGTSKVLLELFHEGILSDDERNSEARRPRHHQGRPRGHPGAAAEPGRCEALGRQAGQSAAEVN